jgi:WD40 repeat protein
MGETLKVWNLDSLSGRWTTGITGGVITSLTISPDSTLLAVGINGDNSQSAVPRGGIEVWDTASGRLSRRLLSGDRVHCVAFSSDGSTLASGAAKRLPDDTVTSEVILFDTKSWSGVTRLQTEGSEIGELRFSPDGEFLAGGLSEHGIIMVWQRTHTNGEAKP